MLKKCLHKLLWEYVTNKRKFGNDYIKKIEIWPFYSCFHSKSCLTKSESVIRRHTKHYETTKYKILQTENAQNQNKGTTKSPGKKAIYRF